MSNPIGSTLVGSSCAHCGAALTEPGPFCTKCGASRNNVIATGPAPLFCTKCGLQLVGGVKFCNKCGTPVVVSATVSPAASASVSTATAVPPSTSAPVNRSVAQRFSSASLTQLIPPQVAQLLRKPRFLIAAAGIVLLLIVVIIVGIAHRPGLASQNESQPSERSGPTDASIAAAKAEYKQRSDAFKAIDKVEKQVNDLVRDEPNDPKITATLDDLRSRVGKLNDELERNHIPENLNKSLSDISAAADQLTPAVVAATDAALNPPAVPSGPPMVPVAGTGDPKHDWPLEYERTVGGPEADLVVRTGDINNLGFGWPSGFDPFSGNSTPAHNWPNFNQIPPQAPAGTDRVIIGTGVTPVHMHLERRAGKIDRIMIDAVTKTTPGDGYSGDLQTCYALAAVPDNVVDITKNPIRLAPSVNDRVLWANTQFAVGCTRERTLTMPARIVLDVGELPSKIDNVVVQIFVDDFQAAAFHSYFQVSLNGTRIPSFEDSINSLDQTGPIGKLVSMKLLPEYWPLLKSGTVNLQIDDPTTHVRDGYAVDFVRILVNPHKFKYQVSLTATVTDADTHKPISGATVSVGTTSTTTDQQGKCELKGIPAGLVVPTANAPGYDQNSVPVDLPAGQTGHADIQLHPHQENTAALEKSIAQTGTVAIYGIHFDTGSAKLRADSMPALNAVLGLINGRAGSNWIISGHTDNQGSDALNTPLSKSRAASVVAWLTDHGVAANRLEPQGFGSTRPVADNATASGRALNRRVEVSLAK
jgi:OOP family OmpA-OmpF porin